VNLKNFAAEVSDGNGNIYKDAVAYAATNCLSYHSGLSCFKIRGQRKQENSAAFGITLCVTRTLENGQSPDDVSKASRVATPHWLPHSPRVRTRPSELDLNFRVVTCLRAIIAFR
jgi:hypothetical protein